MSLITGAPVEKVYLFEEIEDGEIYYLTHDRNDPQRLLVEFGGLNPDGKSRGFNVLNGAWKGTLTEMDEGALELHVHATGSRYFVYITELAKPSWEQQQAIDDEIPY